MHRLEVGAPPHQAPVRDGQEGSAMSRHALVMKRNRRMERTRKVGIIGTEASQPIRPNAIRIYIR